MSCRNHLNKTQVLVALYHSSYPTLLFSAGQAKHLIFIVLSWISGMCQTSKSTSRKISPLEVEYIFVVIMGELQRLKDIKCKAKKNHWVSNNVISK